MAESSGYILDEPFEDRKVLGRWRDTDAGQLVLNLLVPAEETEPIMDRFEQRYSHAKGFHVIRIPVEAVLPRAKPEPAAEQETADVDAENQKNERQRINREATTDASTSRKVEVVLN